MLLLPFLFLLVQLCVPSSLEGSLMNPLRLETCCCVVFSFPPRLFAHHSPGTRLFVAASRAPCLPRSLAQIESISPSEPERLMNLLPREGP